MSNVEYYEWNVDKTVSIFWSNRCLWTRIISLITNSKSIIVVIIIMKLLLEIIFTNKNVSIIRQSGSLLFVAFGKFNCFNFILITNVPDFKFGWELLKFLHVKRQLYIII